MAFDFGLSDVLTGAGLLNDIFGGGGNKTNGGAGTTSTEKTPWGPAQQYISRGLADTAYLNDQYQKAPFSDLQKKYYSQSFGDTDHFRNSVMPGLMNFANQGMVGGYQRGGATIPGQQSQPQQQVVTGGPHYQHTAREWYDPMPTPAADPLRYFSVAAQNTQTVPGLQTGSTDPFAPVYKPKTPTTPASGSGSGANAGGLLGGSGGGGVGVGSNPNAGLVDSYDKTLAALATLGNNSFMQAVSPSLAGLMRGISDGLAKQNNGYGPLTGPNGYADPRDAASKGLGVGNTGSATGTGGWMGGGSDGGYGDGGFGSNGTGGLGNGASVGGSGIGGGYSSASDSNDAGGWGGGWGGDGGGWGGDGGDGGGDGGGFAKGGYVHKGLLSGPDPKGPDDGAANLDAGEYVIKKSAVKRIGKKKLDKMNRG